MARHRAELVAGVTVLGNLAVDVINGGPKTPGGCASFSGVAVAATGDRAGSSPWPPTRTTRCSSRCSTGSAR